MSTWSGDVAVVALVLAGVGLVALILHELRKRRFRVIRARTLHAKDIVPQLPPREWEELKELCWRHGFNPNVVEAVLYTEDPRPQLVFTVFDLDEHGQRYTIRGTNTIACHLAACMLVGALPPWWQPQGALL